MADFSAEQIIPLSFEVHGLPIKLKYAADRYTGLYRQGWHNSEYDKDSDARLIADLVTEWDVEFRGEAVKLDYADILKLPGWAISAVAVALMEDLGKLTAPKWTG
jgi:hypothetical protein